MLLAINSVYQPTSSFPKLFKIKFNGGTAKSYPVGQSIYYVCFIIGGEKCVASKS